MILLLHIMICTMLWERRLIVWPVVLEVNAIEMAPECLVIVVQIIDEYFQNVFVEHGAAPMQMLKPGPTFTYIH